MASFLFKLKEDSLQMVLIVHHKVVFTPAFHLMHSKHMLALKDFFCIKYLQELVFQSMCCPVSTVICLLMMTGCSPLKQRRPQS